MYKKYTLCDTQIKCVTNDIFIYFEIRALFLLLTKVWAISTARPKARHDRRPVVVAFRWRAV